MPSKNAHRPLGITLIAVIIALNGLLSIAAAFSLPGASEGNLPAVIISVLVGLLLINRAYGLWRLRHTSWLITVILLVFKALLALLPLIVSPFNFVAFTDFVLAAATAWYLTRPAVRGLFSRPSPR